MLNCNTWLECFGFVVDSDSITVNLSAKIETFRRVLEPWKPIHRTTATVKGITSFTAFGDMCMFVSEAGADCEVFSGRCLPLLGSVSLF